MSESLSASLRDYLYTIQKIDAEIGAIRANEIAKRLNVKCSSVTGALRVLAKKKLINYSPYGPITITPDGKIIAKNEEQIFSTLKKFFIEVLSIPTDEAEKSARIIKGSAPSNLLERLTQFVKYLEACPREIISWTNDYGFHCPPSICQPGNCHYIIDEKSKSCSVWEKGK
jgi:DtxR family transcriptional regulator, Mn-dependent transcriptional regulator